jgi:hypothetical protein
MIFTKTQQYKVVSNTPQQHWLTSNHIIRLHIDVKGSRKKN